MGGTGMGETDFPRVRFRVHFTHDEKFRGYS